MRKGFEDWEFFIRLLKNGGNCYVIPEVLYSYRKRNDSTTSKANTIKYDLKYYIYLKHKDLYIADYENFVTKLLDISLQIEKQKEKIYTKPEFKIGKIILSPLRFIKSLFR